MNLNMKLNRLQIALTASLICCACSAKPQVTDKGEESREAVTNAQEQTNIESEIESSIEDVSSDPTDLDTATASEEETTIPEETTTEIPEPETTTSEEETTADYSETEPAVSGYDPMFEGMTFFWWTTDGADIRDGIYYKDYEAAYVANIDLPVFGGMDTGSDKQYLCKDDICYMSATDRKNWIYISSDKGVSGWMHIKSSSEYTVDEYAEGFAPEYDNMYIDYSVYTDQGMVPVGAAFTYDHDGDDGRSRSGFVDISDNSSLYSLVETGNLWTKVFSGADELEEFLTAHGASEEVMKKLDRMKEVKESLWFSDNYQIYIMKLTGECLSLRYLDDAVNDRVVIMAYADDEGAEKYYIEVTLNWEEPEENVFLAQVKLVTDDASDVLAPETSPEESDAEETTPAKET